MNVHRNPSGTIHPEQALILLGFGIYGLRLVQAVQGSYNGLTYLGEGGVGDSDDEMLKFCVVEAIILSKLGKLRNLVTQVGVQGACTNTTNHCDYDSISFHIIFIVAVRTSSF